MTVVAFLVEPPHTYAVYFLGIDSIELDYTEDILADLVEFAVLYDPFRDPSMVVIDLSLLPS